MKPVRKDLWLQHAALPALVLLALQSGSPAAMAQPAQRWQEVEVLVFTHEDFRSQISERPLNDPAALQWLPRPTLLQEVSAALAYPFDPIDEFAAEPAVAFGPQPALMNARSFRLPDAARDPFVALDPAKGLLEQDARRLASAGGHRVLWHGVWRQPLQTAARSQSLVVQGGDRYGERHELEGSVRVSDSGGRAQLDLHLWFSQFVAGPTSGDSDWSLPELPAVLTDTPEEEGEEVAAASADMMDAAVISSLSLPEPQWSSNGAWQLRDSRLLTEDLYHYLDNPAFGVLVQIRPYTVPPRELAGADDDF